MSVHGRSAIRTLAFAAACVVGPPTIAQTRPCEDAIAAIIDAGGTIERGVIPPPAGVPPGVEPRRARDDGSDPCRNICEIEFRRIRGNEEAVLAALPGIATLDRPDAITLELDRFSSSRFGELAAEAEALGKLRAVRLTADRYDSLDDGDIAPLSKLSNLEHLSLRTYFGEGATDKGLAHLRDLRRLKSLNLNRCPITDAGLAHLRELQSLETFVADETELTGAGLPHLDGTSLTTLHLIETRLDDEGLANVARFARLVSLSIGHCPVDGSGLPHLAALKELEYLDLSATKVDDVTLAGLPAFPKLHTLLLTRCRIGDGAIDTLKARPGLLEVSLKDTNVTDEGIRRLRVANPRLRIRD